MCNKLENIVVIGQGAIGLLWYHHLSQASIKSIINANVSLLASNQSQLSSNQLKSAQYQFTAYQHEKNNVYPITYTKTDDIKKANIIMLCVKSYHIASALQSIAKYVDPECKVVLAHNGMGTAEEVMKILPSTQPILAMLTTHGSLRITSLKIEHTGLGHSDIGLLAGELSDKQQRQLSKQLNKALPTVTLHKSIIEKQWLKLAINCVINPITAINDIDNGAVNDDKYSAQINRLLTEIAVISQKENININLTTLQKMVTKVARATAKNCSSMRCDVLAGKSTEIDYINGYIHRLGQQYDIATPENTRLWQQVQNLNSSLN